MTGAIELFSSRFPCSEALGGRPVCISSLTGSAVSFLAASLAGCDGPRVVLVVAPGMPDADAAADDARVATEKSPHRIFDFPPPLDGDKSAVGARLKTIAALKAWSISPYPCVVAAPYAAVAAPIRAKAADAFRIASGTGFGEVCAKLSSLGYRRVPAVEEEGDWSVRGCVLDFWSPGEENPVRAEFFGDALEGLRTFDPATQLSIARADSAEILPAVEAGPGSDGGNEADRCGPARIFSLLPPGSVVIAVDHDEYSLDGHLDGARDLSVVYVGDPAPRGVPSLAFKTAPLPGFGELDSSEARHPELFEAARARLAQHLDAARKRGDMVVEADALSRGFEIPGAEGERGLLVVAKSDRVFAKRKLRQSRTVRLGGARINDFEELEPGEYVVHVDYGVGRFLGSSEIVTDGKRSEVFTVEYADGAKLHVPASHAHLLSRYIGVKGQEVKMHRLDGKRWARDREKAGAAVADLAAALLETQAKRAVVPGFAYDIGCDGKDAFYAAFPYEETPDQLSAIAAVEKDMAAQKPMDRLICGDAGYGKTEVAMRAAYIAAMNGKQTAVLAPTTVLAEQHFETFTSRFDGTPVRIESMSRFQSSATHDGTLKRLASGVCDIVIATHALLTPRVAFRDLGLVIIDEEQRFGVKHKEFLKNIRATADILTLSATPIPRTLYLSMTGARDLSVLRTPPRERVEVETTIVRDSNVVVRAAIEAELARGGQVFFLHNRVATIGKVKKRLEEACPKARIVVAHGRMDAASLARKMSDFERGKYDILLSTTIVEAGIDIPRANTILVDQAHTFGLADLYQLRGRVGRSTKRGRAIFLLPPEGPVDSDARERLAALKRHGGLGGGFGLAVRDLELRGAGNLLGSQQSGHIAAIGFGLYCQLLKRTIAAMKGEKTVKVVDVQLNLDFIDLSPASGDDAASAALPYSYVEEDSQRMAFLKRFAECGSRKDVRAVASELADRFGPLPPPARRLVRLSELRTACAAAGMARVDVRGDRAVFCREGSDRPDLVIDLKSRDPDGKIAELAAALAKRRPAEPHAPPGNSGNSG